MLVDYYRGIVQYLENWDKPAPKVVERIISIDDQDLILDNA